LDIFYKPAMNDWVAGDALTQSTHQLWQSFGGDADQPPITDVTLPPLKFPALAVLRLS
jgi:hypothetical protein